MCGKWILAFVMNKLGYLDQQRFNLTAPAQGQRRVLSVACVRPAGFKIVPGKLIICAEQHWKPQRSCFYSIWEAGPKRALSALWIYMEIWRWCISVTSSEDLFSQQLKDKTWFLDMALVNVILHLIWPLDGIDTLYCVAPPSDDRPPSMQEMSFINEKNREICGVIWSTTVTIYWPWVTMRFWV